MHFSIVCDSHHAVMYEASHLITAFEHDSSQILGTLIRLALSNVAPSSTAILKSALALASFHRGDVPSETGRLKVHALQMLADSTRGGVIGATESMCHVAAGMILCILEVTMPCIEGSS